MSMLSGTPRVILAAALTMLAVCVATAQQAVPPPPATPPAATPPPTSTVAPSRTVVARPEGTPITPEGAVVVGQVVDGGGRAVPKPSCDCSAKTRSMS